MAELKTMTASVKRKDGLTMSARARDVEIIFDEPVESGGNNLGPSPAEGLLAAIGACKSVTFALMVDKMRLDINDYTIKVTGELNPDGIKGVPGVPVGFLNIKTSYEIDADAPPEKIKKAVEKAEEKCVVAHTILTPPEMSFEII